MLRRAVIRPALILLASLSLAVSVLAMSPVHQAEAARGFNPANIIHDSNFYTSKPTMSVKEIQHFLNVQGKKCRDSKTIPCLKNFRQTTKSRPADKYCPRPYKGAKNESAASIIWKTSYACNISPQVILVTLQKEQSLITSIANGASGYRTAMGYGCPDFAKCNSQYYGFSNQVYNASRQFQRYRLQPNSFNFAAGRTSFIQYNPRKSCGGTRVKVQNAATAGLYNYTPYQPGGGGKCETYGNKNFNAFYRAWFGDPHKVKKAKPAPKPTTPPANTKAPTGSQNQTAKQAAKQPAQTPKKKPQTTVKKVEPLSLSLEDSSGVVLSKDKGLKAGTEIKVKASNLDAKMTPIVSVDGEEQKLDVKPVKGPKDIVELTLTVPDKPGAHTVVVAQKGEDGKQSDAKKPAQASFWVFYQEPTVLSVTTDDKTEIKDGGQVHQGKKLAIRVAGLQPQSTPAIGYVKVDDKEDQKRIAVTKVNDRGVLDFAMTAPDKLGKYTVVIPGVGDGKGTSFTFEVVEAQKQVEAPKEDPEAKAKAEAEAKAKAEAEAKAKAEAEAKAKAEADAKAKAEAEAQAAEEAKAKAEAEKKLKAPPVVISAVGADGRALTSGGEVEAGETITLKLNGLIANKSARVEMHSTPLVIPVGQADAQGVMTVKFQASTEPGLHHIKVDKFAGEGELVDVFAFQVRNVEPVANTTQTQAVATHGEELAKTGQATAPLLAMMIMLVGSGLAVTSYARARQPISVN